MKKSKFLNSEMAPAASAELFLPPEGPWWWVSMTNLSWCPLSSSLLSQISHEFIQSIYLQYWYAQINVIFSSSLGLALHLLGCSSLRLAIHKMKASRFKWRIERTFNDQHRWSNPWSKNITNHGNLQWNFSQRYMWICSKSALKPANGNTSSQSWLTSPVKPTERANLGADFLGNLELTTTTAEIRPIWLYGEYEMETSHGTILLSFLIVFFHQINNMGT